MDKQPLEGFPQEPTGERGEHPSLKPNPITRLVEALAHLGLGELMLRIGTNLLAVLLVLGVVWLMQLLYDRTSLDWKQAATTQPTPAVSLPVEALPETVSQAAGGIPRRAVLHTTIPTRPRIEVVEYTVQPGDSVFGIADKFGLQPSTILFGNYETLRDTPHSLRPGQTLNILPVDGTYYQWLGTENLDVVAAFFGVEAEAIVNFAGNHLDPDAIVDPASPGITAGTWLIVPGGKRDFTSWSAPIGITRSSPATTRVLGPGACGPVSGGNVGFGTFVFPTVEHWLSGTPFRPDVGHPAVDFAGSLGNAVYATDAGVVVYAGWNDWGYGNLIVIDHGNDWQSLYAHLDAIYVGCGQSVGQGDVIAALGSTGNSTGPHLHFELMNSQYGKVNPLDYLQ